MEFVTDESENFDNYLHLIGLKKKAAIDNDLFPTLDYDFLKNDNEPLA